MYFSSRCKIPRCLAIIRTIFGVKMSLDLGSLRSLSPPTFLCTSKKLRHNLCTLTGRVSRFSFPYPVKNAEVVGNSRNQVVKLVGGKDAREGYVYINGSDA